MSGDVQEMSDDLQETRALFERILDMCEQSGEPPWVVMGALQCAIVHLLARLSAAPAAAALIADLIVRHVAHLRAGGGGVS